MITVTDRMSQRPRTGQYDQRQRQRRVSPEVYGDTIISPARRTTP